ncbi:MAG: ParB/RepB/Spo0J family partition protein [Pseudomonadota bacterium]
MSADGKPKSKRLGKGLSALLGEVEGVGYGDDAPAVDESGKSIKINDIRPNPAQPRRTFSDQELAELANSIRARGVLLPILVRPDPDAADRYQIIAGERRWRAAKQAGLDRIPAIVRNSDDLELLEIGIIENVQREDLNPLEEAEAYDALIKRFGHTQDKLADSVGKSRVHISNTIRLLNLSETSREHLRNGRISAGIARAALGAPDPDALINLAIAKKLTVRNVESYAKRLKDGDTLDRVRSSVESGSADVDTVALEADLSRVLGLDVEIKHKTRGGDLRIKYRNLEQLDSLCRKLTSRSRP